MSHLFHRIFWVRRDLKGWSNPTLKCCFMLSWLPTWCCGLSLYDARTGWIGTVICCHVTKFGHGNSQRALIKAVWKKCNLTSRWFCLLILEKNITPRSINNIFWIRELKCCHICISCGVSQFGTTELLKSFVNVSGTRLKC